MKKLLATTVGLLVCGSAFADLPPAQQAEVHFTSYVNSSSCKVVDSSKNQTISLTPTVTSELNKAAVGTQTANTTSVTEFSIKLENCPLGGFKKSNGTDVYDIEVYVVDGNNLLDGHNENGLLINSATTNKANNVFVQLLSGYTPLKIASNTNEAVSLTLDQPTSETLEIPLVAQLYSPSGVVAGAGIVNATALVNIAYN